MQEYRCHTVGVVGLGYAGLTLAAALAGKGHIVHGADISPTVVATLAQRRSHIFEPGIDEVLRDHLGSSLHVGTELPAETVDVAIISVSSPVDEQTRRPDLTNLAQAARAVAATCRPGTLVVVRSTVPIGTSRRVVLPELRAAWGDQVRLVMAPERTRQGAALSELLELPQVIGGLDEQSLRHGAAFFSSLTDQIVEVSSLETAEMVKLSNNCHTDLIYAFGAEIALIAESNGLDPLEVIHAANAGYPRPDLCPPGYVGGGCLSKDPYIMVNSAGAYTPFLIGAARELNEHFPVHVAEIVVAALRDARGETTGLRLAVLGWAFKGWPPTDDMRGTAIAAMMPIFSAAGITVVGHDPLVSAEVIREYGGEPVGLDQAFAATDAILILNDHPDYRGLDVKTMLGDARPVLIYDSWRILDADTVTGLGIRYAGLGYLPTANV